MIQEKNGYSQLKQWIEHDWIAQVSNQGFNFYDSWIRLSLILKVQSTSVF